MSAYIYLFLSVYVYFYFFPSLIENTKSFTDDFSLNPLSPTLSGIQEMVESEKDDYDMEEVKMEKITATLTKRAPNYVSQSAVALRCRVMPPPCIKNPYMKDTSGMDMDPFGNQRSKCAGTIQQDSCGEYCNGDYLTVTY